MKRPKTVVQRSYSMLVVGYWMARCGERVLDGPTKPPVALGAPTWKAAYNLFYDELSDGRTRSQFQNSLKNTRDSFDTLFDNGRIGWINRGGKLQPLSDNLSNVHEEWKDRSDHEIEAFALALRNGIMVVSSDVLTSLEARTEGGTRVYVSARLERDPKLRQAALAIHGFDCMACGFNFERLYGEIGKGFIEVHHIVPLSKGGRLETDPETDLLVLCSNCHQMVHRQKDICLSLNELRTHLGYTASET